MKLHRAPKPVLLLSVLCVCCTAKAATDKEIRAAAVPVQKINSHGRATNGGAKTALLVSGAPVDFHGAALYESKGELLVPLRPLCEAMGATVSFDPQSHDAIIRNGNLTVRFSGISLGGNTVGPLKLLCDSLEASFKTEKGKVNVVSITLSKTTSTPPALPEQLLTPSVPTTTQTPVSTVKGDAAMQHNLDQLNAYRAKAGIPLLKLDEKLNAFALAGSAELMKNHIPHHHFENTDVWASGFEGGAAENQGDPNGWIPGETNKVIDDILLMMFNEGPGGGHHDNMLNPQYKRVGVGLIKDADGKLYLTNDFSE